jgi:predicted lipoprotein with Yx(FWY)xxD motif
MRRPQNMLVALGLGIALAGGGIAVAQTSHSGSTPPPSTARTTVGAPTGSATINLATTTVAGKSEQILVDAHGLPLYTYNLDTASQSYVIGALAQAWPPLVSSSPNVAGATGAVSVVAGPNAEQVQYDGHFLYTFINDMPGRVTGQGVQGFFVATPDLGTNSSATAANPTAPATRSNPYGY